MPSSPSSLSLAAILTVIISSSSPRSVESFQLSPRMPMTSIVDPLPAPMVNACRRRRHRGGGMPLYSLVDMPMRPMEEEREKDPSDDHHGGDDGARADDGRDDDRREWKKVVGGFVPKFLRRRAGGGGVVGGSSAVSSSSGVAVDVSYVARPIIITVDTLEEYKRIVVDESDSIVVVRFHAPWCKSCKAAYPLFAKMASEFRDSRIKFVEVPLTKETAYIHEGLGVPSVPFGHIYHPDVGLVEERKINRREFGEFRTALDCYVRGSCDVPPEDEGEDDGGVVGQGEGGDVVLSDDEFQ